jgi:phospholipid/cholesterol/gamma-HCH transport system substrate-binding protein
MATPRQKMQVGIFLSVCLVLLVGILLVLSGVRREETIPYFIEFDETVSGLFPGSDVRYRGVPVGRVTNIMVTPANRIRVRIEIRPRIVRIRQGTTAQLNPAGITGQLYINLDGGTPEGKPLAANATLPSAPSLFSNLTAELPTILASINSVLVRLDKSLGEEGRMEKMVQDVESLLVVLNTTVSEVGAHTQTLLERMNALIENEVRPLIGELTATARTTRRVLEHTQPVLQTALVSGTKVLQQLERHLKTLDLQSTNARLQLTLQRITQLAEQLGRSSEELSLTMQHIRSNTTNAEFHIRQAARSLRETLLSAKQLFDYLEQDPSALLTGKRAPVRTRDGQRR